MNVLTTEHKNLSSNPTKNDRAVTQACVTDKFLLFVSLIVHKYFVFCSRSVLLYHTKYQLLNFIFKFTF